MLRAKTSGKEIRQVSEKLEWNFMINHLINKDDEFRADVLKLAKKKVVIVG